MQMGERQMSALRDEFMAAYANSDADIIIHHPHARLIVIQKLMAAL